MMDPGQFTKAPGDDWDNSCPPVQIWGQKRFVMFVVFVVPSFDQNAFENKESTTKSS